MDRYTKGFVLASLVYFFLAACFGILMGVTESGEWVKFAHAHFNLLGFMAMMIYGVGYFILPRFNTRILKWPQLVLIHFIVANLGLMGMVFTAAGRPSAGFTLFAILSLLSVFLFALNLGVILMVYPGTKKVFKKYYGAACFSCPGQATESVRQSAMMHNVDEKKILAELNEAAGLIQ